MNHNPTPRALSLVPFLFMLTAGCVVDDDLDSLSQESVIDQGVAWEKDSLVVCWIDSGSANAFADTHFDPIPGDPYVAERGWVQAVVTQQWGSVARLSFSSVWPPCSQVANADIRIGNTFSSTSESVIGQSPPGNSGTMFLNLLCMTPSECIDPSPGGMCNGVLAQGSSAVNQSVCVKTLALHEFGHALGLRHEQAHGGSTCQYDEPLDGNFSTLTGTAWHDGEEMFAYDPNSIMSYCKTDQWLAGNVPPVISDGDIRGINTLYPYPLQLFREPNLSGARYVFGPGVYQVTGTSPAQSMSAIVPPGLEVTLCSTSVCIGLSGVHRALPLALAPAVATIRVTPKALLADGYGYAGATKMAAPGTYTLTGLSPVGDNAISSLFLPHGLNAKICDLASGGGVCSSWTGDPFPDSSSSIHMTTMDNKGSYLQVTSTVVLYNAPDFRMTSAPTLVNNGFAPGTYTSTSNPGIGTTRSITIGPGLDAKLCTTTSGGGTCLVMTQSGNLPTSFQPQYLQVRVPLPPLPPPTQ